MSRYTKIKDTVNSPQINDNPYNGATSYSKNNIVVKCGKAKQSYDNIYKSRYSLNNIHTFLVNIPRAGKEYSDWVYVWRSQYKKLSNLIRITKSLRSQKKLKDAKEIVVRRMGDPIDLDFSEDYINFQWKATELKRLANLFMISRENGKAVIKSQPKQESAQKLDDVKVAA